MTEHERAMERVNAMVRGMTGVNMMASSHGAGINEVLAATFQVYTQAVMLYVMSDSNLDQEQDRREVMKTMDDYQQHWAEQFAEAHANMKQRYLEVVNVERQASSQH